MAQSKTNEYTLEDLDNQRARIKSDLSKIRILEKYEILSAKIADRDLESSFSDEVVQLRKQLHQISSLKYRLTHSQEMKEQRAKKYAEKTVHTKLNIRTKQLNKLNRLRNKIDADPEMKALLYENNYNT